MEDKTRELAIFELLLSLNRGNSGFASDRVDLAVQQYEELVAKGIIKEKQE